MISTPIHGSFPSGHATEAITVARVLYELVSQNSANANGKQQLRTMLLRQAARIAINRTVAGVHYPIDSLAGQMLGLSIAEYALARMRPTNTPVDTWQFVPSAANVPNNTDFTGHELYDFVNNNRTATAYAQPLAGSAANVTTSPSLAWLWGEALAEWQ